MTNRLRRATLFFVGSVVRRIRSVWSMVRMAREIEDRLLSISNKVSGTDLSGKVVVVTGSTRGIGLVVAKAFARAGAKVVVNGRSKAPLEHAVAEILASGGQGTGICADVSGESGAQMLIEGAVNTFGRLDVLINNAAIIGPGGKKFWEMEPKDWRDTLETNLTGAYLCSRMTMSWMLKNGVAGRVINVSSGAARSAVPGFTPYSVSKAALESLTRNMAEEVGETGPTVVGIELGSLQTDMTRGFFGWEDFQLLPPPEMAVPIFLHVVTEPRERVHGKILAAWRFEKDPSAETLLNGPLAEMEKITFEPVRKNGEIVDRRGPGIVALDRLENPFGVPGKVRELLEQGQDHLDFSRYPDPQYPSLRKALSERLQLPEDVFTFGNGSAELVERAVRIFVQPGEEVVSNDPTWFMFERYCRMIGVGNRKVPFLEHAGCFDHNLDGILQAIGIRTRLIYLVSPSNPLGVGINREKFIRFLEKLPSHIPVIVDEAYIEFSANPHTLRSHEMIPLTDRRVIGLRTFSKFYGLASLRIGYGFAGKDTMRLFNRIEPLFALSSLAEGAAVAALKDEEHAARTYGNVVKERVRIGNRLSAEGLRYYDSETNFMFVECKAAPDKVCKAFVAEGIIIPQGAFREKFILLPVVAPAQNDKNLEILLSVR